MIKLSDAETELKKTLLIKKRAVFLFYSPWKQKFSEFLVFPMADKKSTVAWKLLKRYPAGELSDYIYT